ncbi:MAG: hypothetical protein ACXACX_14580 [Candidatus Hodarchaeales archaeon]
MGFLDYRKMFLFNAALSGLYGILFLLIPKEMGDLNAFVYSAETDLLTRVFGALLIAYGLILLVLIQVTDPKILRNVSIVAMIGNFGGLLVILYGILINVSYSSNVVFMSNFIPYGVIILGYGYLLYIRAYENAKN